MNKKAIIFAGTTEGRELALTLSNAHISVLVSTATEFGESLLEQGEYVSTRSGRMNGEEMILFLENEDPSVVIDATHPYATEVTENIVAACEETGIFYLRLKRQESVFLEESEETGCVYAANIVEAVSYLNHVKGNILLTTGSKDLREFTRLSDYENRIYARVLSLPDVVSDCGELGITGKHLLAMQGPFSEEMNYAMIRQTQADILVTKESGKSGGFAEKCRAAKRAGIPVLVIGRPKTDFGDSMEIVLEKIREFYPKFSHESRVEQKITLVSVGPGANMLLTRQAQSEIANADLFVGASRMIETLQQWKQLEQNGGVRTREFCSYSPTEIARFLRESKEYKRVVVALSGDSGFFSGAKKLLQELPENVEVLPGISSMQYLAAKCHVSWEDSVFVTLHGKKDPVLSTLRHHNKLFLILGSTEDVRKVSKELIDFGYGDVKITVGENLSYETERIISGGPEFFMEEDILPLSICLIERPYVSARRISYGIEDSEFIRDKVPMTKEEIRTIILSKLRLNADSILYDIGAGTGSISVEAAILMDNGMVYAIEKNPLAVGLIRQNRKKFQADRLQVVEGKAPEVLGFLPVPTHAFIGGSNGQIREVLKILWDKNPNIRVVASAVTIETMMELFDLRKENPSIKYELTAVSITKTKKTGSYHMLNNLNAVHIFVITKEAVIEATDDLGYREQ